MSKAPTWNRLWWQACSQIRGIDKETEARCIGNSMFEAALDRGKPKSAARLIGYQAYRDAGGTTYESAPNI